MSSQRTKKGILIAATIWILIAAGAATSYRFVIHPYFSGKPIKESIPGMVSLSDDEWDKLVTVRNVKFEPITFGRGKFVIEGQLQRDLDDIVTQLQNHNEYYLIIMASSRSNGDPEIALKLVQKRAEATNDYLVRMGIPQNRIKVISAKPSGNSGESQTVNFVVAQQP